MIEREADDQSIRTALVTGATGALGKAIATRIAATPGFGVVLICRDEAKAQGAVADIRGQTLRHPLSIRNQNSSLRRILSRDCPGSHLLR